MSVAQKYYLYTDSASHHLFDNFNFSVYIILGNRTKIWIIQFMVHALGLNWNQ